MKQSKIKSLKTLSKGFLKVPNDVLEKIYSKNVITRLCGKLYLCLLYHAYFADGMITVGRLSIPCKRGEWITTYRTIEEKTGISISCISMLLDILVNDGLITVRKFNRFTVITIVRYDDMMKAPILFPPVPSGKLSVPQVSRVYYPRLAD
ncbi:MAG: hypothetical protein LUH01_19180 [Parabacteroides gordonii]|nr:hypothetical protein [Parabacteroides gordonii]